MPRFLSSLVLPLLIIGFLSDCSVRQPKSEVVLYSSIDETYARRAAKRFEEETGISVKLVSDTEVAKSSGLLARLLAEREHPVADVFWSGDVARAFTLEREGLIGDFPLEDRDSLPTEALLADGRILGTAARARVIMVNTTKVPPGSRRPRTIEDLASKEFAPRSCLANPLFGTTAVHAAALFRVWGKDRAERFFNDFSRHGGRMLASNGEVKRRVASGEFDFGITDSDDLHVAWMDGKQVDAVIPVNAEHGGLLLPSAAVIIKNAPHPEQAQQLAAFLSGPVVELMMAQSEAAHLPIREKIARPERYLDVPMPKLISAEHWQETNRLLEDLLSGYLPKWVADQQR